MCLALPSRVEHIDGMFAMVEVAGQRRRVNLMLIDESVEIGDYVLIQNGEFAYERVDPQRARETLALIDELVAANGGADLRTWG